jgi:signal transduction histidine kinase
VRRFLPILLLSLVGCGQVAALRSGEPAAAPIADWWYQQGHDARGATACLRDEAPGPEFTAWHPVQALPLAENGEFACFRFRVPSGGWSEPSLFIEGLDTAYVISVRGERRAAVGNLGEGDRRPDGHPWSLIPLQREDEGHWASLWIRSKNTTVGPWGKLSVGARSDQLLALVRADAANGAVAAFSVAMGLIALAVFLWRRSERHYLWLGVYALATGVSILSLLPSVQLLIPSASALEYARCFSRMFLAPGLAGFAHEIFHRRVRALGWVLPVALALGAVLAGLTAIDYRVYQHLGWQVLLVVLIFTYAAVLMAAMHQGFQRRLEGWGLLLGMAAFYAGSFHDRVFVIPRGFGIRFEPVGQLALLFALGMLALRRFVGVFKAFELHAVELRERNARLETVERELKDALVARENFLSVASHELRTPLTALNLQVQRAMRLTEAGAPKTRAALDPIVRSTERLTQLTTQLLDVSRLQSGRLELSRAPVDLATLARDVVTRMEDEAERAGCTVSVRSAPVEGDWDGGRLDQVITNLLANAFKYGAGRPVEVAVWSEAGRAYLSVADGGIGIAPEHQARIFERFERAVSSDHYAGLGLGLWIVREIVAAHGGRIDVESRPGEGSRFTFTLPGALAKVASA